jgi:hypothetical protein
MSKLAKETGISRQELYKAERYRKVVRNLGKHVTKSEHSTEERELVRAMLRGHSIAFSRDATEVSR